MSSFATIIDDSDSQQKCMKPDANNNIFLNTAQTIEGNCIIQGGLTGTSASLLTYMDTPTINPSYSQVNIATNAGKTIQGTDAIAIGNNAGEIKQEINAIAIGNKAGQNNQGQNAIAIGGLAGYTASGSTGQHANTIIVNASGQSLMSDGTDRCYVSPIRNATTSNSLFYNTSTKEVSYGIGGGSVAATSTNTIIATNFGIGRAPVSVDPTKSSEIVSDYITVIDDGSGWCFCVFQYGQSGIGTAGNGAYVFSLPGSYQFDPAYHPLCPSSAFSYSNSRYQAAAVSSCYTVPGTIRTVANLTNNYASIIPFMTRQQFVIQYVSSTAGGIVIQNSAGVSSVTLGVANCTFSGTFIFKKL